MRKRLSIIFPTSVTIVCLPICTIAFHSQGANIYSSEEYLSVRLWCCIAFDKKLRLLFIQWNWKDRGRSALCNRELWNGNDRQPFLDDWSQQFLKSVQVQSLYTSYRRWIEPYKRGFHQPFQRDIYQSVSTFMDADRDIAIWCNH